MDPNKNPNHSYMALNDDPLEKPDFAPPSYENTYSMSVPQNDYQSSGYQAHAPQMALEISTSGYAPFRFYSQTFVPQENCFDFTDTIFENTKLQSTSCFNNTCCASPLLFVSSIITTMTLAYLVYRLEFTPETRIDDWEGFVLLFLLTCGGAIFVCFFFFNILIFCRGNHFASSFGQTLTRNPMKTEGFSSFLTASSTGLNSSFSSPWCIMTGIPNYALETWSSSLKSEEAHHPTLVIKTRQYSLRGKQFVLLAELVQNVPVRSFSVHPQVSDADDIVADFENSWFTSLVVKNIFSFDLIPEQKSHLLSILDQMRLNYAGVNPNIGCTHVEHVIEYASGTNRGERVEYVQKYAYWPSIGRSRVLSWVMNTFLLHPIFASILYMQTAFLRIDRVKLLDLDLDAITPLSEASVVFSSQISADPKHYALSEE